MRHRGILGVVINSFILNGKVTDIFSKFYHSSYFSGNSKLKKNKRGLEFKSCIDKREYDCLHLEISQFINFMVQILSWF